MVFLGCSSPLVLRPVITRQEIRYKIVGECYVPGLMHTEALLGPLPRGWKIKYRFIRGHLIQVFYNDHTKTQKDPREPLPHPWQYKYAPPDAQLGAPGSQKRARNQEENGFRQLFDNPKTRQMTWQDPRLEPEILRKTGVNLQEFVLI